MAKRPDLRLVKTETIKLSAAARAEMQAAAVGGNIAHLRDLFEEFNELTEDEQDEWVNEVIEVCHKITHLTPEF